MMKQLSNIIYEQDKLPYGFYLNENTIGACCTKYISGYQCYAMSFWESCDTTDKYEQND